VPVTFTSNPPGAAIVFAPWWNSLQNPTMSTPTTSGFNHSWWRTPHTEVGNPPGWYNDCCMPERKGSMPVVFHLAGYEPYIFPPTAWEGAHFHADLIPTQQPIPRRSVSRPKTFQEEYLQDGILPNMPGFHITKIYDNRYPYYIDAEVLGTPGWLVDMNQGRLDPNCNNNEACEMYRYNPPPGWMVIRHDRGGLIQGSGGYFPWCPPAEACGYTWSRVVITTTNNTVCTQGIKACAGQTFQNLYGCASTGTAWNLEQPSSPACSPDGVPSNDPLYWLLSPQDLVITPNQIPIGGSASVTYSVKNTASAAVPPGSFVIDIFIGASLYGTSTKNPVAIAAGATETFTATLNDVPAGSHTVCLIPRIVRPT